MTFDLKSIPHSEKVELLKSLQQLDSRLKYNKAKTYFLDEGPTRRSLFPKHVAFMNAGGKYLERCFIGGNRSGKTETMAFEVYLHATGNYEDHSWFTGMKFNPAEDIIIWVFGVTHGDTKDIHQHKLFGPSHDLGTGLIPKELILDVASKSGVPGGFSEVKIRRKGGGIATIVLKSYVQGRESCQGTSVHFVGLDEECPQDIYEECVTRCATVNGRIALYFTPLKGLTKTVLHFLPGGLPPADNVIPGRSAYVQIIRWEDVPLSIFPQEMRDQLIATYTQDQIEARTQGRPAVGSGKVYNTPESQCVVQPFKIPHWWSKWYAFDIGYNCSCALFFALDDQTDTVYVYDEYYSKKELPTTHVAAIRARGGNWMQGLIDPSALQTNKHDGQSSYKLYRNLGLDLRLADNRVETGLMEVTNRLSTGRLKFFSTLPELIQEYRLYRYHTNEKTLETTVAKGQQDHAMDTLRYGIMDLRIGRVYTDPDEEKSYGHRLTKLINSKNPTTGY